MGLCLVLAFFSFAKIFDLFFFSQLSMENRRWAGQFLEIQNSVQIKGQGGHKWRSVDNTDWVFLKDIVFTEKNSRAKVLMAEGHIVTILENSLVKIDWDQELELQKGMAELQVAKSQLIKLKVDGRDYKIRGQSKTSDVKVSFHKKEVVFAVENGEIEFQEGNQKYRAKKSQLIEIDLGQVNLSTAKYEFLRPMANSRIYLKDSPVAFDWRFIETQKNQEIQSSFLHIQKVGQKAIKTVQIKNRKTSANVILRPGSYRWYVSAEKDVGKFRQYFAKRFSLIQATSPDFLHPQNLKTVAAFPMDSLYFEWKGNAPFYRLSFLQTGFKKSIEVVGNSHMLSQWSPGELTAKVTSLNSERSPIANLRPETTRIDIKTKKSSIEWPKTRDRALTFLVVSKADSKTPLKALPIPLEWPAIMGVSFYEIEINHKLGSVLLRSDTENTQFFPQHFGEHQYRVRIVSEQGKLGPWTELKTFSVQGIEEKKTVLKLVLEKGSQTLQIKMKNREDFETVFYFGANSAVDPVIVKKKVKNGEVVVNFSRPGIYYWKTNHQRPNDSIIDSMRIFKTPELRKPKIPKKLERKIKYRKKSVFSPRRILDFFFPSAHAASREGFIDFDFEKKADAKSWVLEIYQDSDLQQKFFQSESRTSFYRWTVRFPGTYFWRYAIRDSWGELGPWSEVSKLMVTKDLEQEISPSDSFSFSFQESSFFLKQKKRLSSLKLAMSSAQIDLKTQQDFWETTVEGISLQGFLVAYNIELTDRFGLKVSGEYLSGKVFDDKRLGILDLSAKLPWSYKNWNFGPAILWNSASSFLVERRRIKPKNVGSFMAGLYAEKEFYKKFFGRVEHHWNSGNHWALEIEKIFKYNKLNIPLGLRYRSLESDTHPINKIELQQLQLFVGISLTL